MQQYIPRLNLDKYTSMLLSEFLVFFKEFPDAEVIQSREFMTWYTTFRQKSITDETKAALMALLQQIDQDPHPAFTEGLHRKLVEKATAVLLLDGVGRYEDGAEVDIMEIVAEGQHFYETQVRTEVDMPIVSTDFTDLIKEMNPEMGFDFPIPEMNMSMRPMVAGDSIIIAARPDTGKTSFMCQLLTHNAKKVSTLFPDEPRPILWFNNEGKGNRILMRMRQTALNISMQGFIDGVANGTLQSEYEAKIGGSDIIQVLDIHGYTNLQVERIIKKLKPSMVVTDMVDNIRFQGISANGGTRTDQMLEEMYKTFRDYAAEYNFVNIMSSQVSGDGDGMLKPKQHMLKDSKTGKQGACDAILMIGCTDATNNVRHLSAPKNKLQIAGAPILDLSTVIDKGTGNYYIPQ